MKANCAVSVIIPVYNAEKYLGVCLESLLIQTLGDFEVIVVDDRSTDNSLAVAESYLERFGGRLKVITLPENTGSGAVPRNVGLEHAAGKYVFFADADDLLIDEAIETLCTCAEEYRADALYLEKCFMCDEELLPKDLKLAAWSRAVIKDEFILEPYNLNERVRNLMSSHFYWPPWTKFARRDFLIDNAVTFPQMRIAEDAVWTIKVVCLAERLLRVPTPLYVHRENEASMMGRKRSPAEQIKFWISPLIHGLECLAEFMSGLEFFKQKPAVRLQMLNFFALMQLDNMSEALNELAPTTVYEIFLREFAKADSTQPALIAYLLVMTNLYRNELKSLT